MMVAQENEIVSDKFDVSVKLYLVRCAQNGLLNRRLLFYDGFLIRLENFKEKGRYVFLRSFPFSVYFKCQGAFLFENISGFARPITQTIIDKKLRFTT